MLRVAVAFAIVAVSGAAFVTFLGRSDDANTYAVVDGVPITRDQFDAYAGVFTRPDGILLVSRDQVLLSLINQALVEAEAKRRDLSADETAVATAVAAWESLGLAHTSLERSGGAAALAARMRMFELFKLVRLAVVEPNEVSRETLEAAYQADSRLHVLGFEAAAPIIRERLLQDQVVRRWEEWLRRQRECAVIVILDPSFQMPSSTPRAGVPPW